MLAPLSWFVRAISLLAIAFVVVCGEAKPAETVWLRASTPELTFLTSLEQAGAVERANEFTQYLAALRGYFGAPVGTPAPLTFVVFADPREFDRYRPLDKSGKAQDVAGFFVRSETWAISGANAAAGGDARHVIFHEGVHWFLNGSETWMPVWLDEGMAEVFSTFEIDQTNVRWGRELPGRTRILSRHGLMPTRQLLFTGRADLFTTDGDRTEIFYAQAWAFVHYLMFGENKTPRDAGKRYASLVASGTDPDKAFTEAFGNSYEAMDKLLKRYLNGGKYFTHRQPLAKVPPVLVEKATPHDVDEALGRLALVGNRLTLAIAHAKRMIARDANEPRGHVLLGLALKESNARRGALADFESADREALAEFELAAEHGSLDFQPYFEAGFALQNEVTGVGGTLSGDVARKAADYYEKALALRPGFEAGYSNLAGIVGLAEPIRPDDGEALKKGEERFPANLLIQLGLAQVARRSGDLAGAATKLARVLEHAEKLPANVQSYARRIHDAWADEDIFTKVGELAGKGEYKQALSMLDTREQQGADLTTGTNIATVRREILAGLAAARLNAALREQNWSTAREIISEILRSDAPLGPKTDARRILAQLDQRRLGQEADTLAGRPAP